MNSKKLFFVNDVYPCKYEDVDSCTDEIIDRPCCLKCNYVIIKKSPIANTPHRYIARLTHFPHSISILLCKSLCNAMVFPDFHSACIISAFLGHGLGYEIKKVCPKSVYMRLNSIESGQK